MVLSLYTNICQQFILSIGLVITVSFLNICKVLEWGGVPLTERSFEEVCAVLERGGDSVELLVEPAPQLDDQPTQPSQSSLHHHALYGTYVTSYKISCPFR